MPAQTLPPIPIPFFSPTLLLLLALGSFGLGCSSSEKVDRFWEHPELYQEGMAFIGASSEQDDSLAFQEAKAQAYARIAKFAQTQMKAILTQISQSSSKGRKVFNSQTITSISQNIPVVGAQVVKRGRDPDDGTYYCLVALKKSFLAHFLRLCRRRALKKLAYLFSSPSGDASQELDQKRLPLELRQDFQNTGIQLSPPLQIIVKKQGKEWILQSRNHAYFIEKADKKILVVYEKTKDLEQVENILQKAAQEIQKNWRQTRKPSPQS